jgi:hypothetical protein
MLQVICISDSKQPFGQFEDCKKKKTNSLKNLLNIFRNLLIILPNLKNKNILIILAL